MTSFAPLLATKLGQNGATARGPIGTGKPYVMMVPAPGFVIARVIFTDLDAKSKRARTLVITEKRKGRPRNSQRVENGATA